MVDDTTACSQILTACDFLLELKNVKAPADFYGEVDRLRRAAARAKDEPIELLEIKRQLVQLTDQLSDEHKRLYHDRRVAAEADAIVFQSRLKNRMHLKS